MVTNWIITEGMAGTENQCIGVADALGLTPDIFHIGLRQPWATFSPYIGLEQAWSFTPPLQGPWPDLLITSGRKAIAAARYIKKQNPRTFTLHIQDPRTNLAQFDLVAVPHHDRLRGDNVIVTDGAPNRITPERLASANHPSPCDKKSVGVLIGGNSKTHSLSDDVARNLGGNLRALAKDYKILMTLSRRTPDAQAALLRAALQGTDAYIWDGVGANPYFGILAQADWLIVTNDSASMLSDAATSGKPVYVAALEGHSAKFARLEDHFAALGITRPFTGVLENWSYTPLRDAQKIAFSVRKASGLF